ncbi:MAG: ABC transporter permease [Desulfobacteraceae bacterium]|nr:MAG: ABC transporter permease [Desulfobacteraceae bacterium]
MIRKPWTAPLAVWAARDLMRQPGQALLLFCALAAVVALMALVLLIDMALSTACRRLAAQTPAIVVRRVNSGGWAPMPAAEALARIRPVAGVLRPRARVWGVVRGPDGPLTVIGVNEEAGREGRMTFQMPRPGQACVGPGILPPPGVARLPLWGRQPMDFEVIGHFPKNSSMAAHDVVAVHADDARRLLGLTAEQASDLALEVFHEEEVQALVPVLAAAFDWPVQVVTRQEQLVRQQADIARRTGMILVGFAPALLALALVVAALGAEGRRKRGEIGLLKALGWTGGELLQLQLYRGMLVGLPALTAGVACAYGVLFWPGAAWLARWLFDWTGPAPGLYLSVQGAAGGLALSAILAGVPFLAAVFWTGWQAAAGDPSDCIEGGP